VTAIVVLDVETTGKDRARDQVIELCIRLGLGELDEARVWRIKPTVPVHPEAQAVHGISAEDLATCPAFVEVAPHFLPLLDTADVIVGYNVAFDLDMVQAELARAGLSPLDLAGKHVIDVLRLWHHVEPRTLAAAHEKFCGAPLADAHQASADVAATARVLGAILDAFGLSGKPWSELAAIATPFAGREKWIGPSHHLQWDDTGAVIAFGKYRGVRLDRADPGFLRWVLDKDFPPHVKDVCRAALQLRGDQLVAWIADRYPRPTTTEAA
jgi:DNA polymerase-3 subunit epsilon